jgi:tRNA(Ile)-lysidine synthase
MRLDPDWLREQGADAFLLSAVDTCLPGDRAARLGVAVSGGGDSVALLHLAWRRAQHLGQGLEAVTLDHGLRPESAAEARAVADLCTRLGVRQTTLEWTGARGGNTMAAARDARYRLIADWAKDQDIRAVLLGHTADDLAETFLMRLGRKAGLDGLAAMDQTFRRQGMTWSRPLLQQDRAALRAYLRRNAVDWTEDPTNDDPRYDRTRARAALAALAPLGVDAEGLKETAEALRMARSALEHYTAQEAKRHVIEDRGDLLIPHGPDAGLHPDIERRLIARGLQWVAGAAYAPRRTTLANLRSALENDGPRQTAAGCLVTAQAGPVLRLSREPNAVAQTRCATREIWDGRWSLNGPHAPDLEIRALGGAVKACPGWRDTGLPRASLMASPAVWRGDTLIAAPLAGHGSDWTARIVTSFASFLLSH